MGDWSGWRTWGRVLASSALLVATGCGSDDAPADPAAVPGIVEVDPNAVPLGEGDGGKASQGGSSSGSTTPAGGSAGSLSQTSSGLGKACETSADCAAGLSCHMDADYISHLQCTTYCDSGKPCLAIDKNSFCIGANVCVHACSTDADCGPKTRCGAAGWCERSGPGSGVPHCGGFATPCGLLTDLSCSSALGCRDDSSCGGVASSCYSQFDSFSCNSQDGCFWSSLSKNCSGSAHSCSSYSLSSSCKSQEGCYWTPGCSGTARSCADMPVAVCGSQPGCVTQTD